MGAGGGTIGAWARAGALGGVLAGLSDAAAVRAASALPPSGLRDLLLVAGGVGAGLLAGAAVGAGLGALGRGRGGDDLARWGGVVAGAATVGIACLLATAGPTARAVGVAFGILVASVGLVGAVPPGRARIFGAALGLAALAGRPAASQRRQPAAPAPPAEAVPVLLVTIEGLRADAVGPDTTRQLLAVGARGVTYTAAVPAVADGPPALAALLGGPPTLARHFRAAGHPTAAFVSREALGRDAAPSDGFDVYDDALDGIGDLGRLGAARLWSRIGARVRPAALPARRAARDTVAAALRWLAGPGRQDPARPPFLWVHLADPLPPFAPPPPWDTAFTSGDPRDPAHPGPEAWGRVDPLARIGHEGVRDRGHLVALHRGAIASADDALAPLVAAVEALPRGAGAVVAVAGTHGLCLGDGGPWFGVAERPVPAVATVPVVLRAPGRLPVGARVEAPVSLSALGPALAELAGSGAAALLPEGAESLVPPAFGRRPRGPVSTRSADGAVGAAADGTGWALVGADGAAAWFPAGADAPNPGLEDAARAARGP
jgi:hypothetical protein